MIKPRPNSKLTDLQTKTNYPNGRLIQRLHVFRASVLLTVGILITSLINGQTISVTGVSPSPVCAGSNVTVTFNVTNGSGAGNYFNNSTDYALYLSDASGNNFAAQGSSFNVSSGSYNTTDGASVTGLTYSFTIPSAASSGAGYKISLESTNPISTGNVASAAFTISGTPTTADAGPDQVGAATCGVTSTMLAANVPLEGTGNWSIISGSGGSFSNASSNTSNFNGVAGQTYVLRWTISNSPCLDSYDEMTLTFLPLPSLGSISQNATICEGNAAQINLTGLPASANLTINYTIDGIPYSASVSSLSDGTGNFNTPVLSAASNGKTLVVTGITNTSTSCSQSFSTSTTLTVNPTVTPVVNIVASLPAPATLTPSVCANTAITFDATPSNGGTPTYQWYLNGNPVGGNSSQYILSNPSASDAVKVIMTSNAACRSVDTDESNIISVSIKPPAPTAPSTPSGPILVCPSNDYTYSISAVPNATSYNWTIPAGWTINSGDGTTSISVKTPGAGTGGTISVTASNDCGTSSAASRMVNLLDAKPATPGLITGSLAVCPGTTNLTYSIDDVPDADIYTWSVPTGWTVTNGAGSKSITVTSGAYGQDGTISVTATSICGVSNPRVINVSVNPGTPGQPAAITGTAAVCPGTSNAFNIAAVSGASSYTWTVPTGWSITTGQGTNSINVLSGNYGQNGDITVTATNSCGTSTAQVQAVTVKPGTPAQPGAISGTATQCPNLTGQTYSIGAVTNASTYTWMVPTGWNITAGQGTTSITLKTGTTGQNGDISVSAGNDCGTSAVKTFAVTVANGTPAIPSAPTTTANPICATGTGYVFNVASVANATEYIWNFPAGFTIQGSAPYGNSVTVNTSGAASGSVTVQAKNSCGTSGASPAYSFTIPTTAPATPGAISGVSALCPQQTLTYTIAAVSGATTYNWTVPSGAIINSGQGTSSVTVTYPVGSSSGNLSVAASNGCLSSAASTLAISVNNSFQLSAGNDISVCLGNTSAQLNNNSYDFKNNELDWIVPSGWGLGGNNNSNNRSVSIPNNAAAGTYTIRVETNNRVNASVCSGSAQIYDEVLITVRPNPTASISGATTICNGSSAALTITATPNTTVTYNTNQTINVGASGTATLSVSPNASTTYTINSVAYTSLPGCSQNIPGQSVTVTVNNPHIVTAGSAATICQNGTVALTGASITSTSGSGTWTSNVSGGSFSPATMPTTTPASVSYTPPTDYSGSITLTLASTAGTCPSVSATKIITVSPAATVSISPITSPICQGGSFALNGSFGGGASSVTWSTNATGGSFSNANSTSTTYTPDTAFKNSINFTLTTNVAGVCPAVSVTAGAFVNPRAYANAGTAQSVCSGSTITLAGTKGGSASSSTWTSSNGGSFSNASSLTSDYTPSISSGAVTLTLTTNDPDGSEPCSAATSTVLITVDQASTVNAGGPDVVCQSAAPVAFELTGASYGGGATNAAWSIVSGGGSLSSLAATSSPQLVKYTAAPGYYGPVELKLTSNATGVCAIAESSRTVTINQAPVVNAGVDQTICSNGTAVMNANLSGSASTAIWSSTGTGSFNNNSTTATYTATAADILAGSVKLIYTSTAPPASCAAAKDTLQLTIIKEPVINTQPLSTTVCASTQAQFSVQATGDNLSYKWYKVGSPTVLSTSATYTIAQAQTADAGNYYVEISNPTCAAINSTQVTLAVSTPIQITAQPVAATICQDQNASISVTANANGDLLSYQWYKGTPGSGTAVSNGGHISGATTSALSFTNADPGDNGSYYAVINGPAGYSCATATSTAALLTVHPTPVVNPISPVNICSRDQINIPLTGTPAGVTFTWTKVLAGGALNATDSSGSSIVATLFTGASQGTVTYSIIPNANNCPGTAMNAVVTINPKPTNITYSPNADFAICSGTNPGILINSDIATNFNWTVVSSGAGNASDSSTSGTAANINTTLFASGSPGTVQYTISNATAAGCSLPSKTITVTVNPVPIVSINNKKPTMCSWANTDIDLSSDVAGASITWSSLSSDPGNTEIIGGTSGSNINNQIKNNSSSAVDVTYTVVATYAGCSVATPPTTTVAVNPLPTGSITAGVSGTATICLGNTTPITFTGNSGTAPYKFFYSYNSQNDSIPTTSGNNVDLNVTPAIAGSHVYTLYGVKDFNSNESSCPYQVPVQDATITVKPLPTATVAVNNSTICNTTGTANITFTGANGVSPYTFTYTEDGGANQTINSSGNTATFVLTNQPTGTKTFTLVSVAENGATPSCSQNQTGAVTVTIQPDATLSYSTGSTTQSVCANNSIGAITYVVGGTGTNATVTGLPAGLAASYSPGTKVLTISGAPLPNVAPGTYTYSAKATGTCGPSSSLTGQITVYGPPVGGTATNVSPLLLCSTANGGSISLAGQDGTILKWQSSSNGGQSWSDIASTANPLPFTNIGQTTWYRAVIQKTGCNAAQNAFSNYAVASVVPASGAGSLQFTTNPSPAVICTGSVSLTANAFGSDTLIGLIYGGEFDDAGVNLDGEGKWRKTLINNWASGDKVNIEASTNNTLNSAFNLTNGPKTFLDGNPCNTNITYNNNPLGGQTNNTKFMAVIGPNKSSLESPIFSLVGLQTASFDWWQAYVLEAGAYINVELSFDGGATYTTTLATWSGPATYGSPTNFATQSLNLNAYVGLSNLRIRFTYQGTSCSSWGLEKATVSKGFGNPSYTWSLYNPIPAGGTASQHYLSQFVNQTVVSTPPSPNTTNGPLTYSYSISSSAGGCGANITVTVNPVLNTTLTNPAANAAICSGGTMQTMPLTANVAGTSFSWSRSNNTNLTFSPNTTTGTGGSIPGSTYTSITNKTSSPQSVTFTVTPTNANACNPQPMTASITINPNLAVVLSGDTTFCGTGVQKVKLKSNGPFPITVSLSNGQTVTLNSAADSIVTLAPALTATGTVTLTSMTNTSCNATPISGSATVTFTAGANLPVGHWGGGAGGCTVSGPTSSGRDWFNPCNWGGGVVPTNDIDVYITQSESVCDPIIDPTTSFAAVNGPVAKTRNITINGTTRNLSFANGGNLWVAGNWTNNIGPAGFTANTGTVTFMGNSTNTPGCASQTVQTTSGNTETFYNLVINNTCNRDATGDNVVLNSPVNVNTGGTFTLTDGIVQTTSTNILTILNTAVGSVVGGANNSYVNGPMVRYTVAGNTYNYPIGKPNGPYGPYRPARVTPTTGIAYTGEYKVGTAPQSMGNRLQDLMGQLQTEYWDIVPTDMNNCTGDAVIGLPYVNPNNDAHWASSNGLGPCSNCNVAIVKPAPDASHYWGFTDYPSTGGGFSTTIPEAMPYTNNGWLYSKPINCASFVDHYFTFGFGFSVILPVNLLSFNGKLVNEDATLNWSIANNAALKSFELEYSRDGRNFDKLANIAPNGTNQFSYTHYKLQPGAHYYRLLMKDNSGNNTYSKTILLVVGRNVTIIKGMKTTVVLGTGYVEIWSAGNQKARVQIFDMTGRLLDQQTGSLLQGDNSMPVRMLMLPQGVYNLLVTTDDGVQRNLRLMKE